MQCVQNEPLEIEERFMYLGIEVPSHHRWSECVIPILEMRKTTYYALHIYKMMEILKIGFSRNFYMTHLQCLSLFMGIDVWSCTSLISPAIQNLQKHFLMTPYMVLLLETRSLSFEIIYIKRASSTCVGLKTNLDVEYQVYIEIK